MIYNAETSHLLFGLENPDWGDILIAVSLAGAAIAWLFERKMERKLRREELQWRRTSFMFEQARLFDGDPDISGAVKVLTGNDVEVTVTDLLNPDSSMEPQKRGHWQHNLDKLLNLMERIASAHNQKLLTDIELAHFEWYFLRVKELTDLNEYCQDFYPNILVAAGILEQKSD